MIITPMIVIIANSIHCNRGGKGGMGSDDAGLLVLAAGELLVLVALVLEHELSGGE